MASAGVKCLARACTKINKTPFTQETPFSPAAAQALPVALPLYAGNAEPAVITGTISGSTASARPLSADTLYNTLRGDLQATLVVANPQMPTSHLTQVYFVHTSQGLAEHIDQVSAGIRPASCMHLIKPSRSHQRVFKACTQFNQSRNGCSERFRLAAGTPQPAHCQHRRPVPQHTRGSLVQTCLPYKTHGTV
jgi:hypothetical protein